eukprot:2934638-Pyramimonas_sp.AAC.2
MPLRMYLSNAMTAVFSNNSTQDSEERDLQRAAKNVIQDSAWWVQLRGISWIAEDANRCRTWGSGCACHEEELKA